MSFLELAAERYSVRSYSERPVEEEKLAKILEAARIAPTAHNNRQQKIYMLKSKESREKLASVCRCTFGAPVLFIICYDEERVWNNPLREGYNSGEVDSSIICTHMMLAAWEQGIASCWVGFFNADDVAQAFDMPTNVKPVAILPVGYAAEDAKPVEEMHHGFRPMEEILITL